MAPDRSTLEDAATILRAHGINAYQQGDDIVVYAAATTRWTPIAHFTEAGTKEDIAIAVAAKVARLVVGPHTHELGVPA